MNILILRTSALGDIIHGLPVLLALRRAMPEARIAWVVEKVFAPILEGHPDLDEVIPVRMRHWRKAPFSAPVRGEIRGLYRALRGFAPDVALDLMGNHKASWLARLSGAPRRIGAARRDRREPSSALWINEPVKLEGRIHAVDRALALVAPLGVDAETVDFGPERLMAPATPEAHTPETSGRRRVLIQAGAGWHNKRYPTALWGEVAKHLADSGEDLEVLVPVAPGEEELARRVVEASSGAATAFDAGPFPVLASLLRRSDLLLGGDTGPMHLAHALGTPVLCLMGPTDPERHGPYGAPEWALYHRLPCSFCYKRLVEPKACMLALAPRQVASRALELLAAGRPGAGKSSGGGGISE